MQKKQITIAVIVLILLVVGVFLLPKGQGALGSHDLDDFAQCLKDKGVTFYGAFWCPHCQAQKKLFEASVAKLPYVECSNPDGETQNETCNTAGVKQYPTWQFADGERVTGEQTLDTLSSRSGCPLPSGKGGETASTTGESSATSVSTATTTTDVITATSSASTTAQ